MENELRKTPEDKVEEQINTLLYNLPDKIANFNYTMDRAGIKNGTPPVADVLEVFAKQILNCVKNGGKLIIAEGIERSGKSTLLRMLAELFNQNGIKTGCFDAVDNINGMIGKIDQQLQSLGGDTRVIFIDEIGSYLEKEENTTADFMKVQKKYSNIFFVPLMAYNLLGGFEQVHNKFNKFKKDLVSGSEFNASIVLPHFWSINQVKKYVEELRKEIAIGLYKQEENITKIYKNVNFDEQVWQDALPNYGNACSFGFPWLTDYIIPQFLKFPWKEFKQDKKIEPSDIKMLARLWFKKFLENVNANNEKSAVATNQKKNTTLVVNHFVELDKNWKLNRAEKKMSSFANIQNIGGEIDRRLRPLFSEKGRDYVQMQFLEKLTEITIMFLNQ